MARGLGDPPGAATEAVLVARAATPAGEIVLRRRGEILELVVNGTFAMDSGETSTEAALATAALARHGHPAAVLIGGLGLGFTAAAVLCDVRVAHLDIVELAAPLRDWARAGLLPTAAAVTSDPRVRLSLGDIADVLAGRIEPQGPWDLILLDVDNGPGFLVHEANRRLYERDGLAAAYARLRPGGVLTVWSSALAPALFAALGRLGEASETVVRVAREGREFDYALYAVLRPEATP